MNDIQVVILAAGLGKRMKNKNLPKALIPLKGRTLIEYVLAAIKKSGVGAKPIIIIGKMADKVKEVLGPDYTYVLQAKQLGTGHALMCVKESIEVRAENILVLCSDQPLVSPETIRDITEKHLSGNEVLTMGTVRVPDFASFRAGFYDFGRVVRDEKGKLIGIVEKKDATPEQLEIKEINPSYFCFQADWLWQNLEQLKNDNAQGEYYLTDLIGIAFSQGRNITTVEVKPQEALGVNTEEQLKLVANIL